VVLSRVVLAGMLILGGVAAADVATVQTHPEVNPRVSRGEALLTPIYRGWQVGDLGSVEVFATWHVMLLVADDHPSSLPNVSSRSACLNGEAGFRLDEPGFLGF